MNRCCVKKLSGLRFAVVGLMRHLHVKEDKMMMRIFRASQRNLDVLPGIDQR